MVMATETTTETITILAACGTCYGDQEIETAAREGDTGAAITAKCPDCTDGVVEIESDVCPCCQRPVDQPIAGEACKCDGHLPCNDCGMCRDHCGCGDAEDDAYAAADDRLTGRMEEM